MKMKVTNFIFTIIIIALLSGCGSENNEDLNVEDQVNNNVNEQTNNGEEVALDEAFIMEQSFLAMQQVNSLYMATEIDVVEQKDGEEKTGNRTFDVAMILDEPYSQHYAIYIDDDIVEHYTAGEVYEIGNESYYHSSSNEVEWEYFEHDSTVQLLAEEIKAENLDDFLSLSDQFELIEERESEYVLNFHGDFENVTNIIYPGAIDMFEKVQMSMMPEDLDLEITKFTFNIVIEKDTYYTTSYEMNIRLQSTEAEGYEFSANYVMTFDSFNEYESIEVPEDVIDEAVEFVEEEVEESPVEDEESK